MPEIDYRALLVKYIRHVGTEEGSVYITGSAGTMCGILGDCKFTPEEHATLIECADEAYP